MVRYTVLCHLAILHYNNTTSKGFVLYAFHFLFVIASSVTDISSFVVCVCVCCRTECGVDYGWCRYYGHVPECGLSVWCV